MSTHRTGQALLATTLVAGLLAAVPAAASGGGAGPDPASFRDPHANPWFPLRPGTGWRIRGTEDGHRYTQRTTVTHRHRMVGGIRATVVLDVIRRADGSVAERTHDWYAADHAGRVWYLGERTATYRRDGSVIDREGSWEAGRDGAVPGIIMPAHPHPAAAYRQEYRRGDAEDQAWVVQRGAHVRTPGVTSRHAVRTFEWSRLEPHVLSTKLYVRGYGQVLERDVAGGDERFELVRLHRPGTRG
ncbi:hypothetical protein [Nocardioides aquiterrae]|uniref:DUF3108 domain-containing protein n=1 Tax=Nocardioides aquiterrae TaxID=203799 RepID=A0ABN1US15_9ACTN